MINIKKLINLSSYFKRNSLIKESNYLENLIKNAGYDWKEMGKAPHLKKDEPYKEEEIEVRNPLKEDFPYNHNEEHDSWLENSSYEIRNEPINLSEEDIRNNEEDKNNESEKIYPDILSGLKKIIENLDRKDLKNIIKLLENEYKPYAKYLFADYPITLLYLVAFKFSDNRNLPKIFKEEIEVAKESILNLNTTSAKKDLLRILEKIDLYTLINNLGDYGDAIVNNEKIVPFITEELGENQGKAAEHTMNIYKKYGI